MRIVFIVRILLFTGGECYRDLRGLDNHDVWRKDNNSVKNFIAEGGRDMRKVKYVKPGVVGGSSVHPC
jgi:hypothetical protein